MLRAVAMFGERLDDCSLGNDFEVSTCAEDLLDSGIGLEAACSTGLCRS